MPYSRRNRESRYSSYDSKRERHDNEIYRRNDLLNTSEQLRKNTLLQASFTNDTDNKSRGSYRPFRERDDSKQSRHIENNIWREESYANSRPTYSHTRQHLRERYHSHPLPESKFTQHNFRREPNHRYKECSYRGESYKLPHYRYEGQVPRYNQARLSHFETQLEESQEKCESQKEYAKSNKHLQHEICYEPLETNHHRHHHQHYNDKSTNESPPPYRDTTTIISSSASQRPPPPYHYHHDAYPETRTRDAHKYGFGRSDKQQRKRHRSRSLYDNEYYNRKYCKNDTSYDDDDDYYSSHDRENHWASSDDNSVHSKSNAYCEAKRASRGSRPHGSLHEHRHHRSRSILQNNQRSSNDHRYRREDVSNYGYGRLYVSRSSTPSAYSSSIDKDSPASSEDGAYRKNKDPYIYQDSYKNNGDNKSHNINNNNNNNNNKKEEYNEKIYKGRNRNSYDHYERSHSVEQNKHNECKQLPLIPQQCCEHKSLSYHEEEQLEPSLLYKKEMASEVKKTGSYTLKKEEREQRSHHSMKRNVSALKMEHSLLVTPPVTAALPGLPPISPISETYEEQETSLPPTPTLPRETSHRYHHDDDDVGNSNVRDKVKEEVMKVYSSTEQRSGKIKEEKMSQSTLQKEAHHLNETIVDTTNLHDKCESKIICNIERVQEKRKRREEIEQEYLQWLYSSLDNGQAMHSRHAEREEYKTSIKQKGEEQYEKQLYEEELTSAQKCTSRANNTDETAEKDEKTMPQRMNITKVTDWRNVNATEPFYAETNLVALERAPQLSPFSSLYFALPHDGHRYSELEKYHNMQSEYEHENVWQNNVLVEDTNTKVITANDDSNVSECEWGNANLRDREAVRCFNYHFTYGKVHPKPPWFLCANLHDNCEHPYYLDWLDTITLPSLTEQLAQARSRLLAKTIKHVKKKEEEEDAKNNDDDDDDDKEEEKKEKQS